MKRVLPICRSWFDRLIALLILIMLGPSLALVASLLRANTDEPIVLRQDLVTIDGGNLRTYRFRTTGRGSSAFRTIGRFLRLHSIDDFPGLWAVARGQIGLMDFLSLVVGRRR
jgi:lipopolysaccharide/colanic/teichoic acid biosynthesis glycosyltransferase